jgi:hypothetical protein
VKNDLFLCNRVRAFVLFLVAPFFMAGVALGQGAQQSASPSAASDATPRTPDGHPDLGGYWGRLLVDLSGPSDPNAPAFTGAGAIAFHTQEEFAKFWERAEKDGQVSRRGVVNKPIYKPQYWTQIRETDWDNSRINDPQTLCNPSVPRLGIPQRILQTPNEVVFFYEDSNRFRIVPTDGRPHDPIKIDGYLSWFGDSVGHWEGDTLVIDTVALIDQSWIGPNGYVHTEDTHVTERVHRNGNTIYWDATVEDPMLLQPWQMDTLSAKLNESPRAAIWEGPPCMDRDRNQLADKHEGR